MRTITLCFGKALRSLNAVNQTMPSEKGFQFQTACLCVMRTITLCFGKANRTYGLLKCAKQNNAV